MKKIVTLFAVLFSLVSFSQVDYSDQWEDFFSYNSIKDIAFSDTVLYALADNAVFTYDIHTEEIEKLSSVNGLSGETTSVIYYNETFNRLVIGYENGLIEVVDQDGAVTVSPDIVNFNQSGLKRINAIYQYNNQLLLATSFAIIVYDIERLEFGDTYFIGPGSSSVNVNDITVLNNEIYAATDSGIFVANIDGGSLLDANNWEQRFTGDFKHILTFNTSVYTSTNNEVFRLNGNTQQSVLSYGETISGISSSEDRLTVSLRSRVNVYDTSLGLLGSNTSSSLFDFSLNAAMIQSGVLYMATQEFGVLIGQLNSQSYKEVHPEGPLLNQVFSIEANNNSLWVVYGGYDATYTPSQIRQGYSYFNGVNWENVPYSPSDPFGDLVHVTIDKNSDNRVFISSFGDTGAVNSKLTGGLYELVDNQIVRFYNHLNSPLEDIVPDNPNRVTVRVSGTAFDREGNLWVTNLISNNRLKKLSPSGTWTSFDINELYLDNKPGMGEVVIDNTNTAWITTRRNGVFAFNENGSRKRALTTEPTKGNLPNAFTRTMALDKNNRLWIGTLSGLVVFSNPSSIFDANVYDAQPVIILDEGIPKKLLGDQTINSIKVDGANNKWFGTDNAGALYTDPSGQTTLANFNKDNSPLPSNKILKIAVDEFSGKVYFATDKGIVVYNSDVAPFGDTLGEVYAYPNPALNSNTTVTIAGRNGTNIPRGTNVKILDVSGNLVHETNVIEGQEVQGGKVVWNKRNLAGQKVASGIYIVLLVTEDGSETSTTKIAVVN
jgi:ligand-binding sensor domain-containing protein